MIASSILVDTKYIHTISNHPPHILNDQNYLSPSAFIPFCSFAGNISIMGETLPNFSIPVCTKFSPTVLKGQLCYQVDVNQFKDQIDSKKLMSHGLIFLMDYNEDRVGLNLSTDSVDGKDLGDMRDHDDTKKEAMIYIETLGMQTY